MWDFGVMTKKGLHVFYHLLLTSSYNIANIENIEK